jgi:hypothetical protein
VGQHGARRPEIPVRVVHDVVRIDERQWTSVSRPAREDVRHVHLSGPLDSVEGGLRVTFQAPHDVRGVVPGAAGIHQDRVDPVRALARVEHDLREVLEDLFVAEPVRPLGVRRRLERDRERQVDGPSGSRTRSGQEGSQHGGEHGVADAEPPADEHLHSGL